MKLRSGVLGVAWLLGLGGCGADQTFVKIDVGADRDFANVTLILSIGGQAKTFSRVSFGTASLFRAGLSVPSSLKGAAVVTGQVSEGNCLMGMGSVSVADISAAVKGAAIALTIAGIDGCPPSADGGSDGGGGGGRDAAADGGVATGGRGTGGVTGTGGAGTGGGTGGAGTGGSVATGGAGGGIGTGGRGTGGVGTGGLGTGGVTGTGGAGTGGRGGAGGAAGGRGGTANGGRGGIAGGAGTGGAATGGAGMGGAGTAGAGGAGTGGAGGGGVGGGTCNPGTAGALGQGGGGGAMACIEFIGDPCTFAGVTTGLSFTTEDFKRDASGATIKVGFFNVISSGDFYFYKNDVTFQSYGVNNSPGVADPSIVGALDAVTDGTRGTIMSDLSQTARDALVATFSSAETAVTLAPTDDDGTQTWSVLVGTPDGDVTFSLPSAHAPFVGVVSHCGAKINSVRVSPPIPSGWWRLVTVSFAR